MLRRRPEPVVSRATAALFGLVLAAAGALLVTPLLPVNDELSVGDRAPATMVAAEAAQYESSVLTRAARDAAAANVAPVTLPPDLTVRAEQRDAAAALFDEVEEIREREDLSAEEQLALLADLQGTEFLSQAALANLLALSQERLDNLRTATDAGLADILAGSLLDTQIDTRVEAYIASEEVALPPADTGALRELLHAFLLPNVEIDEAATEAQRQAARDNVSPIVRTFSVGQVIAREGDTLDAAAIEALRETGVIRDEFDYADLGAGVLFSLGFGVLIGVYMYQLQPFPAAPRRRLLLVGMSIIGALVATRFALPVLLPDDDQRYFAAALPLGAAAMVVAAFSELRFAVVVSAALAAFATFTATTTPELAGADFTSSTEAFQLAAVYCVGGLAGAVSVYRAERLGRFAFAAIFVAISVWATLSVFWLLGEDHNRESFGWLSLAAAISGLGAAMLGIGAYVILAAALGVTTRLQLMEIAQAGHPLMRRLQDEAPGTYHHSMMVAALAERAADRIGADSLIVRAGAYFHDIGKLAQPEFYIENLLDRQRSPHEDLAPEESARIIVEHVTNGVQIARRNRLPPIVRDFIPQHHGTRLVSFFYRRAREQSDDVDASAFRYAGPRPQTKEAAIVMLADSCEALVRARQARTGEEMDELVDSVFAERLAEGQFDECDVTMRELQDVAASFKSTLRAVYHPRIEYPPPVHDEASERATVSPPPA